MVGRYVSSSFTVRWGLPHPLDRISTNPFFYPGQWGELKMPVEAPVLEICSDAWIGEYVVVTGSCRRIGFGAVLGAGAVVTHDVPDFAVVTGVPAAIRRYRFAPEVQQRILRSRWWEFSLSDLKPWQSAFANSARESEASMALEILTHGLATPSSSVLDGTAAPSRTELLRTTPGFPK